MLSPPPCSFNLSDPPSQRNPPFSPHFTPNETGERPLHHLVHNCDLQNIHDSTHLFNLIKSYGKEKNIQKTRALHAHVLRNNLTARNPRITNALITTYARCGALEEAREVFEHIPFPDVVSWNALISGYAQNKLAKEALECFHRMQNVQGVLPDGITYVSALKACSMVSALDIGENIHAEIRKQGLLIEKDILLANALINMYCKCGAMEKAREAFEYIPVRDVVSWSSLITGYTQNGLGEEALECFGQMQDEGVCPNVVTYLSVLKACGLVGSHKIGKVIELEVRKEGFLRNNVVVGTAIIDMYSKCGKMDKAQKVFDELQAMDIVSWNALIAGYTHNGLGEEALSWFNRMKDSRVCPDEVTYICILKACGLVGSLEIGENINVEVRNRGLFTKGVMLGNALIDMYSKCGEIHKAQKVLEELPQSNVVSWNALISGYSQNELGDESLKCFKQMKDARVLPNVVTYVAVLKACGSVGSLKTGEDIEAEVQKNGLLEKDVVLGTAFVDMYAKCGAMDKAKQTFKRFVVHDITSWNAIIAGYGQLGQANLVLELYSRLRTKDHVIPNSVTFIILINTCSHAGLVEEGENAFSEMCVCYNITPTLEHYTCMIDLFGRAGCFDKMKTLLDKVSHSGHFPLYQSVLGSCRKWRNEKLGRWAFEKSLKLDERFAAPYVSMGNVYE